MCVVFILSSAIEIGVKASRKHVIFQLLSVSIFPRKIMSFVKLKFESYLVLLLLATTEIGRKIKEKKFLICCMLIARETICYTKDIQVAVTRCCVTTKRCLLEMLHRPKKLQSNLAFLFTVSHA